MQKIIRFTAQGSNSAFGGFSHGDLLRCSSALAHHLVEEARVAEYMGAPKAPQAEVASPEPAAAEPAPAKTRRKAAKGD